MPTTLAKPFAVSRSARRAGITVRPVREGAPSGDWGTQRLYEFDGWEVGWITAGSVEAIAAGRTVAEAVEAALNALDGKD